MMVDDMQTAKTFVTQAYSPDKQHTAMPPTLILTQKLPSPHQSPTQLSTRSTSSSSLQISPQQSPTQLLPHPSTTSTTATPTTAAQPADQDDDEEAGVGTKKTEENK